MGTDLVSVVSKDIVIQQENEELDNQLKRHALGFDAMATLVDYLANHCGVVGVMASNSQLKQDMTSLQQSLEDKKQEIGALKQLISNKESDINKDLPKEDTVSHKE